MTNDEIAKHATETAGKMTAHILDPKMARETFDRIYGQCLVGLSGKPMYDCKQHKTIKTLRYDTGRKDEDLPWMQRVQVCTDTRIL